MIGPLLDDGPRMGAVLTVGNNGAGVYGFFTGLYGALSSTALGGYTVDAINWDIAGSGAVGLRLNGTSIPNSDATFAQLILNGVPLARSSATYTASSGGRTLWTWAVDTSAYPTGGTVSASAV